MFEIILLLACLQGTPAQPAGPAAAPPAGATQGDYYVDPAGSDQNPGTLGQPFRTLERARREVRKRVAGGLTTDLTVLVRQGRYFLSNPLALGPEDSGSERGSVTYAAFGKETPVISGGRRITGWKKGPGDLWVAKIPLVRTGRWYFRQLFVNGQRRQRARTPNKGYLRAVGQSSQQKPFQLKFRHNDIQESWQEKGDVEVVALLAWAEIRMQIRKVDARNRVATLSGNPRPSNREPDARYYVENAPDGLDAPGEWRLDRSTGVLSYWPLAGEDMTQADVIAPALPELLVIDGDPTKLVFVRKLRFKGLTFSHTTWSLDDHGYADTQAAVAIGGAFRANGALDCTVESCTFSHLGNYAIQFAQGCRGNHIAANEIQDVGAGGIKLGEVFQRPNKEERTNGNVITDNHIHACGRVYPAAVGIWVGQASQNRIAHNDIHDLYYTAVSLGWTWGYGPNQCSGNKVEFNHLHDVGQGVLSDMGGIYTLGVQPGTVLRNNLIHDVVAFRYGGWGIYPDEGSSEILIENNVVFRCKSSGFHQHYGRENIVRNNVFAMNSENELMRTRAENHLSFTFERNIVCWSTGKLLGGNWSGNNYRFDKNLYWLTGGRKFSFARWSLDEWKAKGQDGHSVVADPLFVNVTGSDFSLRPESPAFQLGFQEIDLQFVGPRPEPLRKADISTVPKAPLRPVSQRGSR